MRVSFLGLGAIGAPMASHLAARPFDLSVWNRTTGKAAAFAREHDVRCAATPADAAIGAECVITCLPSSREVLQVMEGESGVLAGLAPGALVIDCTSGDPAASRELAVGLSRIGVGFVDAPVSGGVKGAEAGTLTVMCGGSTADVAAARPYLESFGGKIIHCGGTGTGQAVKAMNQALLAVHIWSTGECLSLLAKLGVNSAVALDVINCSSGRSNASENLFPERVIGRRFPRTFRLALLDKDVGIARAMALESGVPAPFTSLAAELFSEAHRSLGDEADHVEAVKVIESRARVQIG